MIYRTRLRRLLFLLLVAVTALVLAGCEQNDPEPAEAPATTAVVAPATIQPSPTVTPEPAPAAEPEPAATTASRPAIKEQPTPTSAPPPTATATPPSTPTPGPAVVEALVTAAEGATLELLIDDVPAVTLEIPPNALAQDTTVTILELSSEDRPAELVDGESADFYYRLEPAGLELLEPAVLTLRVDSGDISGPSLEDGIPALIPLLRGSDGAWSMLANARTEVQIGSGFMTVVGETAHFSEGVIVRAGLAAHMVPSVIAKPIAIGSTFSAAITVANTSHVDEIEITKVTYSVYLAQAISVVGSTEVGKFMLYTRSVRAVDPPPTYRCDSPGTGFYQATIYWQNKGGALEAFLSEKFKGGARITLDDLIRAMPMLLFGQVECEVGGRGRAGVAVQFITAFRYKKTWIPSDQIRIANPDACGTPHWHVTGDKATALDGTTHPDPSPTGCGFGRVSQLKFEIVDPMTGNRLVYNVDIGEYDQAPPDDAGGGD